MTKSQIKAELRRSACEDYRPSMGVAQYGYEELNNWRKFDQMLYKMLTANQRTFFLLVAEAL